MSILIQLIVEKPW